MLDEPLLLARLAVVSLGWPLLCIAFGWAVLGRVAGLDHEERFAASFGVGFAFAACSEFLAFVTRVDQRQFSWWALVVMLAVVVLGRMFPDTQREDRGSFPWLLAGLWALACFHLVLIQSLLPNYMGSDWYWDWWMHYDIALVFTGAHDVSTTWGDYTLASRTPLFNLAAAFVMSLAGTDFWVFQLASVPMSICVLAPLYLLLRDLFSARVGRFGIILGALNLWLLHLAWFTWPKMLTAYFAILGLHFYLKALRARQTDPQRVTQWLAAFWISSWLAFLTHQSALPYLLGLVVHAGVMACLDRAHRPGWLQLATLVLVPVLVAGPWYGWLVWTYGPEQVAGKSPVTVADPSASFTITGILGYMGFNAAGSLLPLGLLQTLFLGPRTLDQGYYAATTCYFSVIPGALTFSLCTYLLVAMVAAIRRAASRTGKSSAVSLREGEAPAEPGMLARPEPRPPEQKQDGKSGAHWPEWSAIATFAVLGFLGALFLHPGKIPWGIAHSAGFSTTLVLMATAWGLLGRARWPWVGLVCLGMVGEFLFMFWTHVWLAVHRPTLLDPGQWNPSYKLDMGLSFLRDLLSGSALLARAATAAVQLALGLLLALWLANRDTPAAKTT